LTKNPVERPTAEELLCHEWLKEMHQRDTEISTTREEQLNIVESLRQFRVI
jgi:hypothetical protein